jgi:hypothetical protein
MANVKLLAALATVVVLAGCGSSGAGAPAEEGGVSSGVSGAVAAAPLRSVHGREIERVEDLRQFVAKADLVVVGTVTQASDGRSVGPASEITLGYREYSVDVEEVLKGRPAESVVVEELAYKDGEAVTLNDAEPVQVGQRYLFALVRKTGEGSSRGEAVHRLVSTQTRFLLGADGRVRDNYGDTVRASGHEPDPFSTEQAGKSVKQLLEDVRRARG